MVGRRSDAAGRAFERYSPVVNFVDVRSSRFTKVNIRPKPGEDSRGRSTRYRPAAIRSRSHGICVLTPGNSPLQPKW